MLVFVVLGVTFFLFFSIHLVPGDPARAFLGQEATPASIAALHNQWGLNLPIPEQYWLYLDRLVHLNLGTSLYYQSGVVGLVAGRIPVTLLLLLYGVTGAVLISVPLALLAAVNQGRLADHVVRGLGTVGLGMPSFWIGTVLIGVFGVKVHVFPVSGYGSTWPAHFWSLVLPGFTIAVSIAPTLIRSLRTKMIEILHSDYVAFAWSKGVTSTSVLLRYGLRNASIDAVTILGINIGFLVGSTVIVENVFSLPGLGSLMLESLLDRDFPVIQGITLIFATLVVLVYLLTDLAYAMLDPRVRLK